MLSCNIMAGLYSTLLALNDFNINQISRAKGVRIEDICRLVNFDIVHNSYYSHIWTYYRNNRILVAKSDVNILHISKVELKKIIKKKKIITFDTVIDPDEPNFIYYVFSRQEFSRLVTFIDNHAVKKIRMILSIIEDIHNRYDTYLQLSINQSLAELNLTLHGLLSNNNMECAKAEKFRKKTEDVFTTIVETINSRLKRVSNKMTLPTCNSYTSLITSDNYVYTQN